VGRSGMRAITVAWIAAAAAIGGCIGWRAARPTITTRRGPAPASLLPTTAPAPAGAPETIDVDTHAKETAPRQGTTSVSGRVTIRGADATAGGPTTRSRPGGPAASAPAGAGAEGLPEVRATEATAEERRTEEACQ